MLLYHAPESSDSFRKHEGKSCNAVLEADGVPLKLKVVFRLKKHNICLKQSNTSLCSRPIPSSQDQRKQAKGAKPSLNILVICDHQTKHSNVTNCVMCMCNQIPARLVTLHLGSKRWFSPASLACSFCSSVVHADGASFCIATQRSQWDQCCQHYKHSSWSTCC